MQQRVYEKRVNDVDELCQRLLSVWQSIGQNVIDEAIDQWRARLTACVRARTTMQIMSLIINSREFLHYRANVAVERTAVYQYF